jgi:hypothetical protein
MIADIHPATADGTVTVEDVEFPEREVGVVGPAMGHGADIRAVEDELPGRSVSQPGGYRTDHAGSSRL